MIKLLIVDDHVLFREGLAAIIQEPDIQIIGLAGNVTEALEMAGNLKPDVVLMDFGLPDGNGAEATEKIIELCPNAKIIILTMSEEDENLFAAIRSGAKGYLLKNIRPSKLVAAIRSVYLGESALSRMMTLRLMEELTRSKEPEREAEPVFTKLTQREMEVLRELSTGSTNLEIANRLYLSENTVKYHVHSILEKLGISDRKAAAAYARDRGLVR